MREKEENYKYLRFVLCVLVAVTYKMTVGLSLAPLGESDTTQVKLVDPTWERKSVKAKVNENSTSMPCAQIPSCIASIRSLLVRQIIQKTQNDHILFDELSTYDLSTRAIDEQAQMVQRLFPDGFEPRKFILSTANRVENVGTNAPELIALITDIDFDLCKATVKRVKGIRKTNIEVDIPKSIRPNLLPHPKTIDTENIVTLPYTPSAGCVEAKGT